MPVKTPFRQPWPIELGSDPARIPVLLPDAIDRLDRVCDLGASANQRRGLKPPAKYAGRQLTDRERWAFDLGARESRHMMEYAGKC